MLFFKFHISFHLHLQHKWSPSCLCIQALDLSEVSLFPVASLKQLHKSIHSQWVAGETMFAEAAKSWFQGIHLRERVICDSCLNLAPHICIYVCALWAGTSSGLGCSVLSGHRWRGCMQRRLLSSCQCQSLSLSCHARYKFKVCFMLRQCVKKNKDMIKKCMTCEVQLYFKQCFDSLLTIVY